MLATLFLSFLWLSLMLILIWFLFYFVLFCFRRADGEKRLVRSSGLTAVVNCIADRVTLTPWVLLPVREVWLATATGKVSIILRDSLVACKSLLSTCLPFSLGSDRNRGISVQRAKAPTRRCENHNPSKSLNPAHLIFLMKRLSLRKLN